MRIVVTPFEAPDAAALREEHMAETLALYGGVDTEPGVPPSAADMAVFLVAYDSDGGAVGCGGLRRLDDATAEIKRMYVRPAARGRGTGRALLAALEDHARGLGVSLLHLETGDRQTEAVALYTAAGYRRVEGRDGIHSVWMEKAL